MKLVCHKESLPLPLAKGQVAHWPPGSSVLFTNTCCIFQSPHPSLLTPSSSWASPFHQLLIVLITLLSYYSPCLCLLLLVSLLLCTPASSFYTPFLLLSWRVQSGTFSLCPRYSVSVCLSVSLSLSPSPSPSLSLSVSRHSAHQLG